MSTEAQINANRENGAKGGVKSEAGKAISSQNSRTHGAYARNVVLSTEDQSVYNNLHLEYLQEWEPIGRTECDLTTMIAMSSWKIGRLVPVGTCLWELAMARQAKDLDPDLEEATRNALAFEKMSGERAMQNLERAEAHLRREMDRAIRTLTK